MKHSIALVKSRPLPWPYLFLWISVMAGAVWIQWTDSLVFARFFGDVKPLPVYMLAGVLGFGALRYLDRTFDLQLLSRHSTKSYSIPVLGATVFGCIAICLDLLVRFPEDMNVPFPGSLVFYPSIGFVAEMIFHVLPVTLLAAAFYHLRVFRQKEHAILSSLFISTFGEAIYHGLAMLQSGLYSPWEVLLTGLHILFFSLFQLWIFRRQGFLRMYLVRISYYMIWHMAWGYFRLQL